MPLRLLSSTCNGNFVMLNRFLPALAAMLAAAPAFAADLPSTKAAPVLPPPVVYNWAGLYIGADVGGVWADGRYTFPASTTLSGDSVLGGGFIGYNRQYGSFVVGFEGDVQGLGVDKRGPLGVLRIQQDLLASINGRAGIAFDRVLVYAIGGVAFSDTKFWNGTTSWSDSNVGFDIGGGLEYAFLPNWTVRAEYRYYDFGKVTKPASVLRVGNFGFEKTDSTVRVGLAYKFGAPEALPVVAKY
jgi:outer membrane immunogenic protein